MINKIIISFLFFIVILSTCAQNIVIDTSSTSKYLIQKPHVENEQIMENQSTNEEISFGDRALSIGKGILNRLKARLNLETAAESIKEKKEKFYGSESNKKKKGGP